MTAYPLGFLVALAVTFFAQIVFPPARQQPIHAEEPSAKPVPVGLGLWIGLSAATGILAIWQDRLPMPPGDNRGTGTSVLWLLPAVLPILIVTLMSDFGRPKSERHALGLIASGVAMTFVGFSVFILSSPLSGSTISLNPFLVVFFTVVWLFLLASIVELVSLVPLGVPLFGMALSMVIWQSGGTQQTAASYTLAGIVAGAIVGRALADGILHRNLAYGKAEVFALGFWLTAMTNAAFLKSVALAGFVLPLGGLAVAIIVVMLRAFERSLLLRETPRAE